MNKTVLLICAFFLMYTSAFSNGDIVAGPMLGHLDSNECRIWMMTKSVKTINYKLYLDTLLVFKGKFATDSIQSHKQQQPIGFVFKGLKAFSTYRLVLKFNETEQEKEFYFSTLDEKEIEDFSFLLGSCSMNPPKILKPIIKSNDGIYQAMNNTQHDMMLWLGDNLYMRPGDTWSERKMLKRYVKKRKIKAINDFLSNGKPHYAIWDDHEYGPNNADKTFKYKKQSLWLFDNFWANPNRNSTKEEGIYTKFNRKDCDFFLMDSRYYRSGKDKNGLETNILGISQMEWIKNELKNAKGVFKFIVIGTQFINTENHSQHECHFYCQNERNELINFINKEKIDGVVFLSGDMHYTELLKMEQNNAIPLYDLTCSPLTSPVFETPAKNNIYAVKGTLTFKRNYGRISIYGEKGDRMCKIEIFDENGKQLWEHFIDQTDLEHHYYENN